jgi:hypothetical protein
MTESQPDDQPESHPEPDKITLETSTFEVTEKADKQDGTETRDLTK